MSRIRRLFVIAAVAIPAFVFGSIGGCVFTMNTSDGKHLAEYRPLPHHVPKNQAGLSFRFAMAHDVLHERYAKHGPAYYRERERIARAELAKLETYDPATFPLIDDIAVALYRTGRADDAIALLREKLARQQRFEVVGRPLYTTYANLGTALTESQFERAAAGAAKAKELFREGVELTRRAIEINPQAHFGRETWQAAHGEFLLAAMDDPALLKRFDFTGNRLVKPQDEVLNGQQGREYDWEFTHYARWEVTAFFEKDVKPDDGARWAELVAIRKYIRKTGAEDGWKDVLVTSIQEPQPFDEAALGVVGMWRQGSGVSPHLALALAETMLRVGQRYLAWTAYERAARTADQFWSDAHLQDFVRDYCRKRQSEIERWLTGPNSTPAEMRRRYEQELAFGERYQRAYHLYEEEKLSRGTAIDDEHFYDEFHADRAPIATPPGPEEQYVTFQEFRRVTDAIRRAPQWGLLAAGIAAMGVALLLRRTSASASANFKPAFVEIHGETGRGIVALLALIAFAGPAVACDNFSGLSSSEQEFRSMYGDREPSEESTSPTFRYVVGGAGWLLLLGATAVALRRRTQ